MKKATYLIFAFGLLLLAQSAFAAPPGGTPITATVNFDIGGGTAKVDSGAYLINSGSYEGKYAYTYQITNIDSGANLSFLSIGINNGVVIDDWNHDIAAINPAIWTPVADNLLPPVTTAQSFEALFNTQTIKSGNTSAVLWFVSENVPGFSQGALFGNSTAGPQYDTEQLIAPVPEPATLSLVAIGGAFAVFARRRKTA